MSSRKVNGRGGVEPSLPPPTKREGEKHISHLAQAIIKHGIGDVGGLTYPQQYTLIKKEVGRWKAFQAGAVAFIRYYIFGEEKIIQLTPEAALQSLNERKASQENLSLDSPGIKELIEQAVTADEGISYEEIADEWRRMKTGEEVINLNRMNTLMKKLKLVEIHYRGLYQGIQGGENAPIITSIVNLIREVENTFGSDAYPREVMQKKALEAPMVYMDTYYNLTGRGDVWEGAWRDAYQEGAKPMEELSRNLKEKNVKEGELVTQYEEIKRKHSALFQEMQTDRNRLAQIKQTLDEDATKWAASPDPIIEKAFAEHTKVREEQLKIIKEIQDRPTILPKASGKIQQGLEGATRELRQREIDAAMAKIKESQKRYDQVKIELTQYPEIKKRIQENKVALSFNQEKMKEFEALKADATHTQEEIDIGKTHYAKEIGRLDMEINRDLVKLEKFQKAFFAHDPQKQALFEEMDKLRAAQKAKRETLKRYAADSKALVAQIQQLKGEIKDLHNNQTIGKYIKMWVYNEAFTLMQERHLSAENALASVKNEQNKNILQRHLEGLGFDLRHYQLEEEFNNS